MEEEEERIKIEAEKKRERVNAEAEKEKSHDLLPNNEDDQIRAEEKQPVTEARQSIEPSPLWKETKEPQIEEHHLQIPPTIPETTEEIHPVVQENGATSLAPTDKFEERVGQKRKTFRLLFQFKEIMKIYRSRMEKRMTCQTQSSRNYHAQLLLLRKRKKLILIISSRTK